MGTQTNSGFDPAYRFCNTCTNFAGIATRRELSSFSGWVPLKPNAKSVAEVAPFSTFSWLILASYPRKLARTVAIPPNEVQHKMMGYEDFF